MECPWVFHWKKKFADLIDFDSCVLGYRLWELACYADGDQKMLYVVQNVTQWLSLRLIAIAEWSEGEGLRTDDAELLRLARMHRKHAEWAETFRINCF